MKSTEKLLNEIKGMNLLIRSIEVARGTRGMEVILEGAGFSPCVRLVDAISRLHPFQYRVRRNCEESYLIELEFGFDCSAKRAFERMALKALGERFGYTVRLELGEK